MSLAARLRTLGLKTWPMRGLGTILSTAGSRVGQCWATKRMASKFTTDVQEQSLFFDSSIESSKLIFVLSLNQCFAHIKMKAEHFKKNKHRKKEKESKLSKRTTALKEATPMIFIASSCIKSYSCGAFIRQA